MHAFLKKLIFMSDTKYDFFNVYLSKGKETNEKQVNGRQEKKPKPNCSPSNPYCKNKQTKPKQN